MQNKPNFLSAKMNLTIAITRDYQNIHLRGPLQSKPNLLNAQISVSAVKTKEYECATLRTPERQTLSNPIRLFESNKKC